MRAHGEGSPDSVDRAATIHKGVDYRRRIKTATPRHATRHCRNSHPPVGYSEQTSARIYAYLASVRPLCGVADLEGGKAYQRGRSLVERMAMSAIDMGAPQIRLSPSHCADVLRFIADTEPLEPRDWWEDPEARPAME